MMTSKQWPSRMRLGWHAPPPPAQSSNNAGTFSVGHSLYETQICNLCEEVSSGCEFAPYCVCQAAKNLVSKSKYSSQFSRISRPQQSIAVPGSMTTYWLRQA